QPGDPDPAPQPPQPGTPDFQRRGIADGQRTPSSVAWLLLLLVSLGQPGQRAGSSPVPWFLLFLPLRRAGRHDWRLQATARWQPRALGCWCRGPRLLPNGRCRCGLVGLLDHLTPEGILHRQRLLLLLLQVDLELQDVRLGWLPGWALQGSWLDR